MGIILVLLLFFETQIFLPILLLYKKENPFPNSHSLPNPRFLLLFLSEQHLTTLSERWRLAHQRREPTPINNLHMSWFPKDRELFWVNFQISIFLILIISPHINSNFPKIPISTNQSQPYLFLIQFSISLMYPTYLIIYKPWRKREDRWLVIWRMFKEALHQTWGAHWLIGWLRLQMNTRFFLKPFISLFHTLIDSYLTNLSLDLSFSCLAFHPCSLHRKISTTFFFLFINAVMLVCFWIKILILFNMQELWRNNPTKGYRFLPNHW